MCSWTRHLPVLAKTSLEKTFRIPIVGNHDAMCVSQHHKTGQERLRQCKDLYTDAWEWGSWIEQDEIIFGTAVVARLTESTLNTKKECSLWIHHNIPQSEELVMPSVRNFFNPCFLYYWLGSMLNVAFSHDCEERLGGHDCSSHLNCFCSFQTSRNSWRWVNNRSVRKIHQVHIQVHANTKRYVICTGTTLN